MGQLKLLGSGDIEINWSCDGKRTTKWHAVLSLSESETYRFSLSRYPVNGGKGKRSIHSRLANSLLFLWNLLRWNLLNRLWRPIFNCTVDCRWRRCEQLSIGNNCVDMASNGLLQRLRSYILSECEDRIIPTLCIGCATGSWSGDGLAVNGHLHHRLH